MHKPSLRTRIVSLTSRGMWILTGISLAVSILLLYIAERSDTIVRTITGILGLLGVVSSILIAFVAVALMILTKGSRKLDEALSQRQTNTLRTGVILDETDYQNK